MNSPEMNSSGHIFEPRKNRAQRRREKRMESNFSHKGPWSPTRREFLKAVGITTGALVVLGIGGKFSLDMLRSKDPYAGWEKYQDSVLPKEIAIAIGEDLKKDTSYPGFSEIGPLVIASQLDPEKIKTFYSSNLQGEVSIVFANTIKAGSLSDLEHNTKSVVLETEIYNKSRHTQKGVLVQINSLNLSVRLDNTSYLAPDAAKRLLLVKEFSHFLYIAKQREIIKQEVLENFEIVQPKVSESELGVLLQMNAFMRSGTESIVSLGERFENAIIDLDGAGYWHIMRAYGKMKVNGVLSPRDVLILGSDDLAFETARQRGLLIEKKKGEFVWKEGIGPFSPQWTDITRKILSG